MKVEEEGDSEKTSPPFYLQTNRTISFERWAVRCQACGGRRTVALVSD